MPTNKPKQSLTVPVILGGALLFGGMAFVLGRSSAPNPPANFGTDEAARVKGGSEGETHEEGHAEGEEGHEEHGAGEAIMFSPEALEAAQIEVAPVALKPQIAGLPFNGEIEASPDNVARVASVVSGRITRLFVAIGQNVRQGQTLALVESRSVGEAQAAYQQAVARLQNARSNFDVVQKQARAGVFSRGPLETARRAQVEAVADVRTQQTAVQQARVALDNAERLARAGSFSRPSLEAARGQYAAALEAQRAADAALTSAQSAAQSAQAELTRRRQIAQNGGYASRPVEEAKRVLTTAQSARATAQSEVATTRANLSRAKSLAAEGLVSTRDLEAAQSAFDTATARLESAGADVTTASQELQRQTKLAATNVAGSAEVSEAQSRLASATADERTRRAEGVRAREGVRLANLALNRERSIAVQGIANRREISQARATVENAQNALEKARQTQSVTTAALQRETAIFRGNLNNTTQLQSARAALVSAQSDLSAAQTALALLKSTPSGSATVPLRAPISGIVQERAITQGAVIEADKDLITLVNLSTVHVDMFLPERDIARVRVGSPVQITVDAAPGRTFSGQIELIHTELDPKTRTIEAHAELVNPGILRPGMFARGTIGTGSVRLAVMVPADAVQDMEGKKVVFVAGEKTGEFEAREVETGATTGGQTLIKSGLKPGEKAVVKGAFMVKAQSMKAELGHED